MIPIEFDERPPLSLGYNLSRDCVFFLFLTLTENPFTVAQEFCVKHKLAIAQCKEPIAKHIIQLTKHYQVEGRWDDDEKPAPKPAPQRTFRFVQKANNASVWNEIFSKIFII